jgi:hypothetical protein
VHAVDPARHADVDAVVAFGTGPAVLPEISITVPLIWLKTRAQFVLSFVHVTEER